MYALLTLGNEVIDLLNYVLIIDEFFLHRWIENEIEGIAVGMTETLSNVILLKHLVEKPPSQTCNCII
jgi:hypothetical protein